MSGKEKNLIIPESRKCYSEEAVEGATALSQGDDEFDGADDKFEEAQMEANVFDTAWQGHAQKGQGTCPGMQRG